MLMRIKARKIEGNLEAVGGGPLVTLPYQHFTRIVISSKQSSENNAALKWLFLERIR